MTKDENKYEDYRIFVAVPSTSMVHADFCMALCAMGNHNTVENIRMALNNYKGSDITHSRNVQVQEAKKAKATHILFVDSDMVFPPWACQRLLDVTADEGHAIVGVTVPKRVYPYNQIVRDMEGTRLDIAIDDNRGFVECSEMGTGMVMIDMKVFEDVQFPWFDPYYKDDGGEIDPAGRVSEDIAFFSKASNRGYKVMCDIQLSKDMAHIGEGKFDFTSEHFFADAIELRRQKAQELMNESLKEAANG